LHFMLPKREKSNVRNIFLVQGFFVTIDHLEQAESAKDGQRAARQQLPPRTCLRRRRRRQLNTLRASLSHFKSIRFRVCGV
jgi:hypothetical protein